MSIISSAEPTLAGDVQVRQRHNRPPGLSKLLAPHGRPTTNILAVIAAFWAFSQLAPRKAITGRSAWIAPLDVIPSR